MGGDYGRGFWSVALLLRCAGFVVGLALSSLVNVAHAVDSENAFQRCGFPPSTPDIESEKQNCISIMSSGSLVQSWTTTTAPNGNWYGFECRSVSYPHIFVTSPGVARCFSEPQETECQIPSGTTKWFDSNLSSICAQNCQWSKSAGSLGICLGPNGDNCSWSTKYQSQDQYCENPSGDPGPIPRDNFDEFTDEDGCYHDTSGNKFCFVPSDSPCPNYIVIDGKKYCRGAEPDDGEQDPLPDYDSDGDGIPDRHDEHPDDADADGDGTPDGEQDGDGNGIPDGDPGGIADDGEGDGNEPGEGHHDGGTCEPDERAEPECSENMDPIQCALAIELFHVRCDARMDHQDFIGDDEYLEGPSITSGEDGDGDGQPDNAVPTATLDAGTVVAGLSEDTISFGNLACPADRTFSMPGAFGGSFTLSWEPICDWAAMVRPIVIALGYLMSALIILRKFSGGSD